MGSASVSKWQCSGRVLGVDLSTSDVGLVVLSESGIFLRSWTLDCLLSRRNKGDHPISEADRIARMLGVANEIVGICKSWSIRHVGISGYAPQAQFRFHQVAEVAGVLKTQIWMALRIVPEIIPPNAACKHVVGGARPSKSDVTRVVQEGLGYGTKSDREAGAAIVARFLFDKKSAESRGDRP